MVGTVVGADFGERLRSTDEHPLCNRAIASRGYFEPFNANHLF